jgi:hypothetical protein
MTDRCVRSGFCCKKAPCPFGVWDYSLAQCRFLQGAGPGAYECAIHDDIIQEPDAALSPAFGTGCSSTMFNEDRDEVLRRRR